MFPNFVDIASKMPAFMEYDWTIIMAKPDTKITIEPITDNLIIDFSISIRVCDNASLSLEILDIGPHNHSDAEAIPATIICPKREGNLATASGIDTS